MLNDHSELGMDLRALTDFSTALAQPFTVVKDVCANMPLVSVLLAHSLFFMSLLEGQVSQAFYNLTFMRLYKRFMCAIFECF